MNDILPSSEKIFTATAKPTEKIARLDIGIATSLESIADGLQSSDTIDSTKVNDIIKHMDKNKDKGVQDALSLLRNEMNALEVQEVAEALATIDSPWSALAKEIAGSNEVQYVDKLLFPLGAELYRDIRAMTTDPLTRQLMFQSIADDIRSNPDAIRMAQQSIPKPKDAGTVKHAMRRVSIGLLGNQLSGHQSEAHINALYKKSIHTAVLRSRLSAEQPRFDLANTEQIIEKTTRDVEKTMTPFVKEEAAQTLRETRLEQNEMKRIRHIIDAELPRVHDETSLMQALDKVQNARFEGTSETAPYKLESWVPESVRTSAREALEQLSIPKEDLYAKALKKLDAAERQFRSQPVTWSETKYKDHMKWLADPLAQANRTKRMINIVDLIMTITTLASGVTGGIQRQIEGGHPPSMSIADYIDYVESQHPWEAAADLATPKQPKHTDAYNV